MRHNDYFQYGHIREFNVVFLDLSYCLRWAKVPLLAHNFSKRAPAIRRPSQDEFLRARCLFFLKNKRYVSYHLGLIKNEPNRLSSRDSRTPALGFSRDQRRLDRKILLFRRDLNHGCTLKV